MKCRPARCCISQSSIENRIISIADSRVWRSISAWLAIEKAVHGGLTTSTVGQSLRISLLTSFWSRELLRSNLRPVLGSRMAISMDQPPLSPRAVAVGQIRGGEKTSHTSYLEVWWFRIPVLGLTVAPGTPVSVGNLGDDNGGRVGDELNPPPTLLPCTLSCAPFWGPVSATRARTGVQDSVPISSSCTSAHDLLS